MTDSKENPWREKYLNSLDEQERLEAEHQQHSELLKRALVRVSLAAEGLDTELDEILESVRAALRQDKLARLDTVLEDLEASILGYDKQREQQQQDNRQALLQLLRNLPTGSKTSRATAAQLRQSLQDKTLDSAQLAEYLQQLAQLTAPPLDPEDPSFQAAAEPDDSALAAGGEYLEGEWEVSQSPDNTTAEEGSRGNALEGQFQSSSEVEREDARAVGQQKPVHEPEFSRVSDKVNRVLNDFLDQIEAADSVAQKAVNARQRLDQGLNWYELVPTLEDIRDLVLQAYLAADDEYRQYLLAVDESLLQILSALGLATSNLQQRLVVEREFESCVSQQLGGIARSVSEAREVDSLKQQVSEHLGVIEQALRDKREHPITDELLEAQLEALGDRLKQMEAEASETRAAMEKHRQKSLTDPLTSLPNREAYTQRLYHEQQRWQRHQHPLTLAVCDIDHFKRINDSFGHQAGDRVLQVLAKGLKKRLREIDFVGRYGGEEFVVILPETSKGDAWTLLDKIRAAIATTGFRFSDQPVTITLSIGMSQFAEGDSGESVFARADKLLYQAKHDGRNRCLVD